MLMLINSPKVAATRSRLIIKQTANHCTTVIRFEAKEKSKQMTKIPNSLQDGPMKMMNGAMNLRVKQHITLSARLQKITGVCDQKVKLIG